MPESRWQLQKLPQPRALGAPEGSDGHPAIGAAEHRGDGDHNHVAELVPALESTPWVIEPDEVLDKGTINGKRGHGVGS